MGVPSNGLEDGCDDGHKILSFSYLAAFVLEEAFQFLFLGQFKLVLGNEEAVVHVGGGVFDQGVVFLRAEQEPHRRIVTIGHHVFMIPGYVGVELAEVFMGELVHFELDEDMAFQDTMVENQIHEPSGLSDDDALLPGFEAKAVTEFHQEFMQVVQESIFEVGFADGLPGFESKEFEDVGISDGEFWLGLFGGGVGHVGEFFFIHGKARPLVIQGSNLPFERPHGPIAANALDLVESAFEGVFEGEEFNKVCEGKPLDQSPRIRSKFGNHRFPSLRSCDRWF